MIVVVDYGMGNVASVLNMGRKAGGDMRLSGDPAVVAAADKLILPGVGAFDRGMENLHRLGLVEAMNQAVFERKAPMLGVCLGAQLFTRGSEEGRSPGLGWIDADTIRFRCDCAGSALKVPHMGWNHVEPAKDDAMLNGLPEDPRFYFVHSFHLACNDPSDVLLWATHGVRFPAGIRRGNIWGMQFHPEKSHRFGLALMRNFVSLPLPCSSPAPFPACC